MAIGLSGGFIEPLESTGLYLSQIGSSVLAEHFPYGDDLAPLAFRFNRIMANRFYEILDFINMHYCTTRRRDTEFWREVARPERINDRLKAKFEYWRIKPPSISDFEDQFFPGQPGIPPWSRERTAGYPIDTGRLWNHYSYETVLYGMDFPARRVRHVGSVTRARARRCCRRSSKPSTPGRRSCRPTTPG